jgi:hypothetical protein
MSRGVREEEEREREVHWLWQMPKLFGREWRPL